MPLAPNYQYMNILVTGGTGFVGTHLCTALHERGHDVTALARSPDDSGLPDGVTLVTGDATDYDSIVDAFEGQDVVVNLVALAPMFKPKGGDRMHEVVHLGGTENVVKAGEAHDLDAIVQMSALGADPDGATAYIRAKGRAEAVVRESDLPWTIFRPSVVFGEEAGFLEFTKTLSTPFLTALPGGGKTRFQPIWIEDLVGMMAEAVEDDSHRGQIYDIAGPQALTLADVTRLVYRADGKSVSIVPVPMSLAGIGLALADPVPFVPFGSDQYRSLQFDNTIEDNDVAAFGRSAEDLRTLSDFLAVS
jgi:NADH dehydrogenase